ncbi:hypothetical protein [Rhodopila sp.]|uniref:hypothetical protein n=1 Tax=Rhodopila sp. TaxID=2480087 RepID=UPI003D0A1092
MSFQMSKVRVGFYLILLLTPWSAKAASFDCRKVLASPVAPADEKAICSNDHLSALDDLLGTAYTNIRRKIGEMRDGGRESF